MLNKLTNFIRYQAGKFMQRREIKDAGFERSLVIYLHADDLTKPSWAFVEDTGLICEKGIRDNAEKIAELAQGKVVLVLVPAEDVLLTEVKLPKMNRSRLLQALPFAIEDQLISEVEKLHFAPLLPQSEGNLPVAIVSHDKMQQWLTLLQSWHIKPDALIPASLALPLEENAWSLFISDMFMLRTKPFFGFGSDNHNVKPLLHLVLSSGNQVPEKIHIKNATEQTLEPLNVAVPIKEEKITWEEMISELAKIAVKLPSINLLQGVFSVKKSKQRFNKLGKLAIYFTAAWFLLLFLYPTLSYFILKQRVNQIDQQIAGIYKHNFPQASDLVAPKLRMQEKLQKLSNNIGDNKLLLLLGYVGKGASPTSSIKLKRFDFQNNQLTLELTATSSEDLSSFTDSLSTEGLSVKQQNASLSGSRINAMLVIE